MVKPLKIDGSQKKFHCITIWPRLLLNTDSDNTSFLSCEAENAAVLLAHRHPHR